MTDMEYEHRLRLWMRQHLDRLERGSRTDLARRLGRSRSAVSRMLSGKSAIAHHDVLIMEQVFGAAAPLAENRHASGLSEQAAAWSGAKNALDVFHKSLRRLDEPKQAFLLDCSIHMAKRLKRLRLVNGN